VVDDPTRHAVTFDGPHNGPLQEHAIVHMAMIFTALAESALRTFAASLWESSVAESFVIFFVIVGLLLALLAALAVRDIILSVVYIIVGIGLIF
jgi:hypothetical protein